MSRGVVNPSTQPAHRAMTASAFPPALRAVFTRLPQYPASAAFAAMLTLWLGKHLNTSALPELTGRTIRVQVSDLGLALIFAATRDGFVPCAGRDADVTLTATAQDFLLLAQRREDPDTLFFARRLAMEGDTELGLLVKNTLDALDPAVMRFQLPAPAAAFRLLRAAVYEGLAHT